MMSGSCSKLSVWALAFAFGIAEGLGMMVLAWVSYYHAGYGVEMIHLMSSVFYGYAPTIVGGLYGGLWGLIDGFIFGIIFGIIYNLCCCCCCKKE